MKLSNAFVGAPSLIATAVLGQVKEWKAWGYLSEITTGPVEAQFKQTKETIGKSLDVPRIFPRPNSTSFNWWYFDAVNPANLNESVVIVFYLATNESFALTANTSVSVDIYLSWADGSSFSISIDSKPSNSQYDYSAVIVSDGGPAGKDNKRQPCGFLMKLPIDCHSDSIS